MQKEYFTNVDSKVFDNLLGLKWNPVFSDNWERAAVEALRGAFQNNPGIKENGYAHVMVREVMTMPCEVRTFTMVWKPRKEG